MATLKFDRTGACPGGGHTFLDVLVNGSVYASITVETDKIVDPPPITNAQAKEFVMTLLLFHRRKWLRDNPSGTNAQYVAALEAEEWVF